MTYLQHVEMTPAQIRAYWREHAPQANHLVVTAVDYKRGTVTMALVVRGKRIRNRSK